MKIVIGWAMALAVACAGITGCGDSSAPGLASGAGSSPIPTGSLKYDATLTRTELGIPHIRANRDGDFASMGYGLGYAFAEDNLCVFLDDIVTIRGERAQFFGRAGTYTIPANGSTAGNVDSDFFWRSLATDTAVANFKKAAAPEAAAATSGFKDGVNRYIGELKAGAHAGRHAACAQGAWLRALTEDDMYRRYIRLGVLASSSVFVTNIAQAAPPAAGSGSSSSTTPSVASMVSAFNDDPGPLGFFKSDKPFGSNMYALGKDATTSGVPMVFGNPHFPWSGTERLYISHITVPGRADIMGSSLYGVPAILIGFNDHLAWSHTVSTAYRFTFYELTLAPGDATSYVYNGTTMKMDAVPMSIPVLEADGSMTTEKRTLYRSKFGPMLTLSIGTAAGSVNLLPWTNAKAYTLRDANFENTRLINQFFGWNQAQSLDEFKSLHKSILGVPWVNTVAAGPGSTAYYGDVTVVPNVPNSKAQTCSTSAQAQALAQVMPGLALLDGSMTSCEWDTDADAPAPGIFGPKNLPTLERSDYVANNNDSYWLTNPAQPITGYAKIIGSEGTERTLRSRLSLLQMQRRLAGTDGRAGKTFDMPTLQDVVLGSHIYSGELARDDVESQICPLGSVIGSNGPVDVSGACAVLAKWKLSDNLDDVGGHIWREFFSGVVGVNNNVRWLTPFSASDPVNTPHSLNVANPQIQQAFGDAVTRVNAAKVPLDATIGSIQRSGVIGDTVIPIFGGIGSEGAFTIVSVPRLSAAGYPVTYGNSYIQTVTWDSNAATAKVHAEGFITYSESTDPANPHYFDFTQQYSGKQWQAFPFHADEVQAHAQSSAHLTE